MKNLGASALPNANNTQWVATVIGFRGDSISPASGEQPYWDCNTGTSTGTATLCNNNNTSGSSSSGATVNPNTGLSSGASLLNPVNGPAAPPAPPTTGNSSGGSQ